MSWIIAFYLLSLTLAPILEFVGLQPEVFCCEEISFAPTDVETSDESANRDCATGCNPFVSCHCCGGFTIPELRTFFRPALYPKVEGTNEKPSKVGHYIHIVWHPPKTFSFSC